jgi:pSer/pThr/pTyr-binding forkhead associated (FHA) protein
VRQTVEPGRKLDATELIPRQAADPIDEAPESHRDEPFPSVLAWLIVKEPQARRGEILPVVANQIIGREGDLRWDDPRLSRQHARLTFEPPEDAPEDEPVFHLWPFGPTNPVYINGREIRGATPLHENDEIRLGDTLFVFKVLED